MTTTSAPAKLRFSAVDVPDTIWVTNATDASIAVLVSAATVPSAIPASAGWHTLSPGTRHDFAATHDWMCVYARAADGATVGCYVPAMAQVEFYRVAKDEPILLSMFDLVGSPTTTATLDAHDTISVHATNSAMDVTVDGTSWHAVAQGGAFRIDNVLSETMVAVRFKMGAMEVRGGVLVAP
ncbi:hypothetical protein GGF31_003888, partial [Allomyces arbusculus]